MLLFLNFFLILIFFRSLFTKLISSLFTFSLLFKLLFKLLIFLLELLLFLVRSKAAQKFLEAYESAEKIITDYQVVETGENFKEKSLELKEKLATKRITADKGQQVPGQITQNNTYIFNPKEQFDIMKQAKVVTAPVELPNFDLS